MLADVAKCAEWTQTGGRVGVHSNAASSVLTLHPATHISAAVRCNTGHT